MRSSVGALLILLTACSPALEPSPRPTDAPRPTSARDSLGTPVPIAMPGDKDLLAFVRDETLVVLTLRTGVEHVLAESASVRPVAFTISYESLLVVERDPLDPYAPITLARYALGDGRREELGTGAEYAEPVMSPDGRWVAYELEGEPPKGGIGLVDLASGELRRIETPPASSLAWSPDSRLLAFRGWDGELADLYLLSVEDGQTRRMTRDQFGDDPVGWTDDGSGVLVFTDRGGDGTKFEQSIWRFDLRSGELTRFAAAFGESAYGSGPPTFPSPNGRWEARIYGSRLELWMTGGASDTRRVLDRDQGGGPLTWSPDGTWLVWLDYSGPGDGDLFMVRAPDGETIQLTEAPGAEVSPVWGPSYQP